MIVYGTTIKSDIAFPLELSQDTETQYEIELSSKVPAELRRSITCGFPLFWSHGRKIYLYSDRVLDGNEAEQPWCYDVADVVKFYWFSGERTIYYELDEGYDAELLSFWFIHQMLPMYMTLEGMYDFIHAGAVEVDGKPILFIAPSMGGKSTLTDFFIKKDHRLISDDKVPTFIQDGKFMSVPSHPYHRPFREFEVFGLQAKYTSKVFNPIHAFYVLEKSDKNANTVIEEIKGFKKFDMLLESYIYTFSYLKPKRLKYLGKMLNSIRVFRVKRPWNMDKLGEVYHAVCEHSREL